MLGLAVVAYALLGQLDGPAAPIGFAAEVMPILDRAGCNSGSCHGKSNGQGGFRLSLLGSDPAADWASLTRDAGGRRVDRLDPGASLFLLKATGAIPHGGGRRIAPDGPEARALVRWVAEGMPDAGLEPAVVGLGLEPARFVAASGSPVATRATARFADGSTRDVTGLATFTSNDPDLAAVDPSGRVSAVGAGIGEAAVVARYAGQVAAARAVRPGSGPAVSPGSLGDSLVDRLVADRLARLRVVPAPPCTDREFARRSALDLNGVLPTPAEVAAFVADPRPDRRARWVESRVDRPEFADLFALKWSALLRNRRTLGSASLAGSFAFHDWLSESFAANRPFDRFAADLLTARGDGATNPAVVWYRQVAAPADRADDAARVFLGVRIECARCHHHPTERWTEADHRGFAAVFARVGTKPGPDPATPRVFTRSTPEGDDRTPPRPPGGPAFDNLGPRDDPRDALVDWLRQPDNPFFARAIVNRTWKHFLGRGLVEPEDDFRASNPPTDPDLLDALGADFVAHGYDFRHLVRTIGTSQAYGRSSLPPDRDPAEPADGEGFRRFLPRRLPAEVLLDAIDAVTGVPTAWPDVPPGTRAVQLSDNGFTSATLDRFGRPPRLVASECERGTDSNLGQALHLLHSAELHRKIADPAGRAARMGRSPASSDPANVDELYGVALGRPPNPDERAAALDHLAGCRSENRTGEGYEDLVWALLNTKAFLFVH